MGRKSIGVSELSKKFSEYVRAEQAVRGLTKQDMTEIIGRGYTYVSERIEGRAEWTVADLGAIADTWGMDPGEMLHDAINAYRLRHRNDETVAVESVLEDQIDQMLQNPTEYGLIAHTDTNKRAESETDYE